MHTHISMHQDDCDCTSTQLPQAIADRAFAWVGRLVRLSVLLFQPGQAYWPHQEASESILFCSNSIAGQKCAGDWCWPLKNMRHSRKTKGCPGHPGQSCAQVCSIAVLATLHKLFQFSWLASFTMRDPGWILRQGHLLRRPHQIRVARSMEKRGRGRPPFATVVRQVTISAYPTFPGGV